jgi:hypothetical protein
MRLLLYIFLATGICSLGAIIINGRTGSSIPLSKPLRDAFHDPCAMARLAAVKASDFSRDSVFKRALLELQSMADDGKEHGVAFGKNTGGNVIASRVSTGNANSARLESVPGKFADLHNHPHNYPPSSGDIYGLIDLAASDNNFQTRYIIIPNGTVYALVVADVEMAKDFNSRYPRVPNPGYQPKFPDVIVDAIIDMQGLYNLREEVALAHVLKRYRTGVALLKQDEKGNFVVLNVEEIKTAGGKVTYIVHECR